MLEELKSFGRVVEDILRADSFPARIEPEFLRDAVLDYPLRGGKRLRPALVSWGAGAVGGDPARARFAAAAVEVWHNWTLVHDDIIDDDDFRRGAPSTHRVLAKRAGELYAEAVGREERFGRDFAILTGDLQQAWANHLLLRSVECGVSATVTLGLVDSMQNLAAAGVISGEALDVAVEYDTDTQEATVERILYLKTGALLEFAVTAGARIGCDSTDGDDPRIAALGRFAAALGIAFQLQDDLLGVYGDEKKFGKPLASDWKERKPTLLYLAAVRAADAAQRAELDALFGLPRYGEAEVARLRRLLDATGAAAAIRERAAREAAGATAALQTLPETPARGKLEALAAYLLHREV